MSHPDTHPPPEYTNIQLSMLFTPVYIIVTKYKIDFDHRHNISIEFIDYLMFCDSPVSLNSDGKHGITLKISIFRFGCWIHCNNSG